MSGTAYASVAVKGGAKIAMTGSFSTEEELVLTGSSLNVSGALTLPGNLTLSNSTLMWAEHCAAGRSDAERQHFDGIRKSDGSGTNRPSEPEHPHTRIRHHLGRLSA